MGLYKDGWFWVSCALFLCVVGLSLYILWKRTTRYVEGEGELPLTTKGCGEAEHALIYASQEEIDMLKKKFRGGEEGKPLVLPTGVATKVKCYTTKPQKLTTASVIKQMHDKGKSAWYVYHYFKDRRGGDWTPQPVMNSIKRVYGQDAFNKIKRAGFDY